MNSASFASFPLTQTSLSSAVSLPWVHLLSIAPFTMVCLCWSMLFDFCLSLVLEDKAGLATISDVMLLDSVLFLSMSWEELVLIIDETVFNCNNSFTRGPFRTVTLADVLLMPCFMVSWLLLWWLLIEGRTSWLLWDVMLTNLVAVVVCEALSLFTVTLLASTGWDFVALETVAESFFIVAELIFDL